MLHDIILGIHSQLSQHGCFCCRFVCMEAILYWYINTENYFLLCHPYIAWLQVNVTGGTLGKSNFVAVAHAAQLHGENRLHCKGLSSCMIYFLTLLTFEEKVASDNKYARATLPIMVYFGESFKQHIFYELGIIDGYFFLVYKWLYVYKYLFEGHLFYSFYQNRRLSKSFTVDPIIMKSHKHILVPTPSTWIDEYIVEINVYGHYISGV